jgi:hypothetical protein
MQPGKSDLPALYSIMYCLNERAREHGDRRRFRCFVPDTEIHELRALIEGMSRERVMRDVFIPLPFLNNRAMISLMRGCAFGLAYNAVPEPFGFYPLESVYNGCPVYTNGCGNNRHMLPQGMGIITYETERMAFGDYEEYRLVAARIYEDMMRRSSSECAAGRAHIRRVYTPAAFNAEWRAFLDRLDAPRPSRASTFDDLVFDVSPLVRSLFPSTRRVVSDYAHAQLTKREWALLELLLGERSRAAKAVDRPHLESLFEKGVLTLRPAARLGSATRRRRARGSAAPSRAHPPARDGIA